MGPVYLLGNIIYPGCRYLRYRVKTDSARGLDVGLARVLYRSDPCISSTAIRHILKDILVEHDPVNAKASASLVSSRS